MSLFELLFILNVVKTIIIFYKIFHISNKIIAFLTLKCFYFDLRELANICFVISQIFLLKVWI